jgi:predicted RNase H-like HicB family nuclease
MRQRASECVKNIPEAITQGKSLKEAKEMAATALETTLDFYFETELCQSHHA